MRTYSAVVAILLLACGTKGDETSIPERQYVAVEVLRIGSPDDSATAFTWFRELEVGPNGDIYTFHGQEHNIRVHSAEGRLIRPQPFSDTELVGLSDYSLLVVRVNRTAPTTGGLQAFSVTALLVDNLIADYALGVSRSPFPSAPPQARAEEWARRTLYVPAFHPPVSALLLGRDGSIWLRGEMTGEPTVKWRILGPAGSLLGAVRLPVGLYAYAADVNQIWGMEQDELDVPYIVSYRVGSTGEPG